MSISRAEFESLLGPLQDILDVDRRRREAEELQAQKELDRLGLANAKQASFGHEALVTLTSCGAFYASKHWTTERLFTIRQENKSMLSSSGEAAKVSRELAVLQSLASLPSERCRALPSLLRQFASDSCLFYLFQARRAHRRTHAT